eukprot:TRINITY_DN0_c7_g1_i1.p1 TRINITY_DN0_c7_g1~~TRINITY_DN0_c7_g1_i1.p1  ORF type:complete len:749 (-),score=149.09 TRINITY_DN0_c7_g1_i1:247-2493(-)
MFQEHHSRQQQHPHIVDEDEIDTTFQNDDDLMNLITYLDNGHGQTHIKLEPHMVNGPYIMSGGNPYQMMQNNYPSPQQMYQQQQQQQQPGAQYRMASHKPMQSSSPLPLPLPLPIPQSQSQSQSGQGLNPNLRNPMYQQQLLQQQQQQSQQYQQQVYMQQQAQSPSRHPPPLQLSQSIPNQQVGVSSQSSPRLEPQISPRIGLDQSPRMSGSQYPTQYTQSLSPRDHSPRGYHVQQPPAASSPVVGGSGQHSPPRSHPLLSSPMPALPLAPQPLQPHQQLIAEILKLHVTQREQLEKMRQIQRNVMVHPQKETFTMLDQEQNTLKQQIDAELASLQQIDATFMLSPTEIRQVTYLIHELTVQSIQLELFHDELQLLVHPQPTPPCIAALVIMEQPFPMVITKLKTLEDDPVLVQLLTASRTEFSHIGKVRASMVIETQQATKSASTGSSSTKAIENEYAPIDESSHVAKFQLKFLNGTRKNPVTLKFSMSLQVAGGAGPVTIESPQSSPFIVITNECQYEESDGTILKKDSFGSNVDIPWPSFANKLQKHFLRATRQDPVKPTRYLSRHELIYIHQNFFGGKPMVSQQSFDSFWAWFGKNLQKLRYQRHVCSMWQSGLIYGFISRHAVDEALRNEDPGTFLMRFSERHAGLFAVGYKIDDPDPEKRVRHYLVRPDDTAGAKKTLPDFLADCPLFSRILQLTIDSATGEPRLRSFPKDIVLEPYYSKRESIQATNGYDSLPGGRAMITD